MVLARNPFVRRGPREGGGSNRETSQRRSGFFEAFGPNVFSEGFFLLNLWSEVLPLSFYFEARSFAWRFRVRAVVHINKGCPISDLTPQFQVCPSMFPQEIIRCVDQSSI